MNYNFEMNKSHQSVAEYESCTNKKVAGNAQIFRIFK